MTPREAIFNVIRHNEVRPVPYTLPFDGDVADAIDKHYGSAEWRGRIANYMQWVSACHTMKKTPLPDGRSKDQWGAIWRTDKLPMHLEQPALLKPSFEGYEWPKLDDFRLTEQELADNRKACEQNKDRFLIGGVFWGLFEQSWSMRGFENAMMDCVAEEDFFVEMLDRITERYLTFVDWTCALPVDAVMFGDDWSDQRGVLIGPERWRKLYKPRWAKIYQRVHEHGKLVITHCCGSVYDLIDDAVEIGLDVLESVQPEAARMNPYELKKRWGDRLAFWGGLGAQGIIPFGTPERIRAEVRKLRREMGRGGGYILAPAKAVPSGTPIANAVAVLEAFLEDAPA